MIDVPLLGFFIEIDLRVAQEYVVPIAKCSCVVVQTTNRNGATWASAKITVQKSITGQIGESIALATATDITGVGIVHLPGPDVEQAAYLHFLVTTTESASGKVQLHFYGTDIGAASGDGHDHGAA